MPRGCHATLYGGIREQERSRINPFKHESEKNGRPLLDFFKMAILFAVYVATAHLGLKVDALGGFATLIWAPTGIALSTLLLFGYQLWPGIALAAFFVNVISGAPPLVACGMAAGNTLEAVLGAYFLNRAVGFEHSLARQKDVVALIAIAAVFSTLVSATIGVTSMVLGDVIPPTSFASTWRTWWTGDMLSDLIVAPLVLTWASRPLSKINLRKTIELVALTGFLAVTTLSVFGESPIYPTLPISQYPFVMFPSMLWAAVRFGPKGSASVIFFISIMTILYTARGLGPFAAGTLNDRLLDLHAFLGVISSTGMILAAAINERKDREQTLLKSDRIRTAIVENSLDCIITMDQDGMIRDFNPSAEKVFGYHRSEVVGRELAELILPRQLREDHRHGLATFNRTGESPSLNKRQELTGLHKDGTEIPVEFTVTPVKVDGSTTFYGFLRDITERKEFEKKLLKQNERIKSVVDHVVDGIITINEHFRIETWNPAAKKIFGYDSEEVIGKNVDMLMPEPYHSQHDTYVANYLRTGQAKIIGIGREVAGKRKDGSVFPMDLAVSEFKLGTQRFFTGIVRDITERKKNARDLLKAKEAAESANLAKSAFLANMSHEIRTPLGAVIGFSDLIIDPQIPASERANFVAAIKRNGELLSNIINDILDLSKVEAGKMQIDPREAALAEILTDTKTLLDLQAREKGIALDIEVAANTPEIIRTDPLRLRQILLNIIGNAIKFTTRGTVHVKIQRVSGTIGHDLLAFTIKDTGPGIRDDQLDKLFTPFSQADGTSKRKHGGTGLGLVLSKRLANLLGGDVQLTQTTPESGSTFTVTIDPGSIHPIQAAAKDVRPQSLTGQSRRLDGVRVLLAEDSPDNQVLVSRILRLAGATVEIAANGKEALDKAWQDQYDIVLMDLQMPIMDGYEATAELRHSGYSGKIVALTAHALADERDRCLRNGFDDHLSKPVNRNILIERVDNYSRQRSV